MPIQTLSIDYDGLPEDVAGRREALLEAFAEQLFRARNGRVASVGRLLSESAARDALGTIHAKPYNELARFGPEVALPGAGVAKAALDNYIHYLLAIFTNVGSDVRIGPRHALRYRLVAEVIDVETHEVVEETVINRDTEKALMSYFGRWLNRYGASSKSGDAAGAG
jgi:hypothetical protein